MRNELIIDFFFIILGYTMCHISFRLPRVMRFSRYIGLLALDYGNRHIEEIANDPTKNPFDWFIAKSPSVHRLIFSFKPFKLAAWFDKDTIEKIRS